MFHSTLGKMNVTTGSQGRFYNCSDKWSRGKRRKTQLTQWGIATTSWGEQGIYQNLEEAKTEEIESEEVDIFERK